MDARRQFLAGGIAMHVFGALAIGAGFAVGGALCGPSVVAGWTVLLLPSVVMQAFAVVLYRLYRRSSRQTVAAVRGLQAGWAT